MDFFEFIHKNKQCNALEEGFALLKLSSGPEDSYRFTLDNVHSIILVLEGEMTIRIDNKQYLLTKNCFVDTVDKLSFELITLSKNVLAYQLLFTKTFIVSLLKNNPPFPLAYVLNKREQPISLLDTSTVRLLSKKIKYLETTFQDRTHYFHSEMLKYALWMFFLDISNAFLHWENDNNNKTRETERKKILFKHFFKLLQDHISEERSVNFYASKLCITPQYLNRIIKSMSGRTVYDWISTILTGEIYQHLENTEDTIQLLADKFNFPDQATFTKFFKRQSGLSPTQYRKKPAISCVSTPKADQIKFFQTIQD